MNHQEDFSVNKSMFDMFHIEIKTQTETLQNAFSILIEDSSNNNAIDDCIRSSLSIKGAAQLVKIKLALNLASTLEGFFIFLQEEKKSISKKQITTLFSAIEYLSNLANLKIEEHENPEINLIKNRDKLITDIKSYKDISTSQDKKNKPKVKTKIDATNNDDDIQAIDPVMFDLFKTELENNTLIMSESILIIENEPHNERELERLMRSSHSIKGAARLLGLNSVVETSHALEDCFVAAQQKTMRINGKHINTFLSCIDLLKELLTQPASEYTDWIKNNLSLFSECTKNLLAIEKTLPLLETLETNNNNNNNKEEIETIEFDTPENIDPVILDLFKTELENNIEDISNSLLELENYPRDPQYLEQLMRASHSIKGAAKLLGIDIIVKLSHVMEDCVVAAQNKIFTITENHIDIFLKCADIFKDASLLSVIEHKDWTLTNSKIVTHLISDLNNIKNSQDINPRENINEPRKTKIKNNNSDDSVVKVSAKRINKLMSLAGELSVTSNWIRTHSDSMLGLKKKHNELVGSIDRLRIILEDRQISDLELNLLNSMQHKASNYRDSLTQHIIDLDDFDRRTIDLSGRINHEIISSRMRPFKDSTQGYNRMVRDISRSLNKKINLEIVGNDTQVDREILEKIEAPINHMIRNAIDHGIEMPADRVAASKAETGTIRLKASHNAGRLSITVSDDGRGVDIENIRQKVLEKKLVSKNMSDNLSKSELLDFLFLPAFSTRDNVTEISGRGVGLDVVHSALQKMRGKLHSQTELGKGMSINMELPITLSVIRSLLVKINKELYAFPLAAIHNLITIKKSDISILEDKQYISLDDKHIGLIYISQILGITTDLKNDSELSVVIIGDWNNLYGLVVDEMIGERRLALRPLDPRLGKVKDISSTALTDDGEPILIFDVDDLIQSIRTIVNDKNIMKIGHNSQVDNSTKRILVVDDSLTVREVEKKLLESRGYNVDVAIDGVDAWNTVRSGNYNLVVSDVDMPRMNGIELVTLIKNDAALRKIPVMMVSYKDRPEDKLKGLDAGADYYLTKGSFHDETLIEAVRDLIGDPI